MNTNPVRGMRDFRPEDTALREYVKKVIVEVYKEHGYTMIQTPAIENINLLLESDGGENLKLIYKILKRGKKLQLDKDDLREKDIVDLGLRYDLTLPLSRFYANNYNQLPIPFKSMQIGEVYRAERPQKGRYRSLVQCDIDIIGQESEMAELELINTTAKALLALDFKDFTIRINDRRLLSKLIEYAGFNTESINSICITFDKLDKIGIEGISKELKQKGYDPATIDNFTTLIKDISKKNIEDFREIGIDDTVLKNLQKVISIIDKQSRGQYSIVFDPSLVRGMGYYTGMIFEIESKDLGCSIAGGGRYDKMIGRFMKNDVPAVGFSIGFERIICILQDKGFKIPNGATKLAFLYNIEEDSLMDIMEKAEAMRSDNKIVSLIPKHKKLNKQFQQLKSQGFDGCCYMNNGTIETKNFD